MIELVKRKIIFLGTFLILLILILNLIASTSSDKNDNSTVKVMIYDGDGVMDSSVEGIEDCLNDSNNQNISQHKFEYSTTDKIDKNTLYGYNVLIMPGGDASTYIENDDINGSIIKQFVQNGNGYIGICAGAYAASNSVEGYYSGWGITPDVDTINENYTGLLSISTTSYGNKLINGSVTYIHMENGPALHTNNSQIVMANFADNNTGYQNFAAIIAETVGSGRVILSGPHPELYPENPRILTNMVLWCSNKI